MNYHKFTPEKRNVSKPMSEQMQKLAARYEKATGKKFDAQTNAQKIRGMSDEELAELMRSMMDCDSCRNMFSFKCDRSYEHCSSVCLNWLQQTAKEEGKHETD